MMHRGLQDYLRSHQSLWISATYKDDDWIDADGVPLKFTKHVDFVTEHAPERQQGDCARYTQVVGNPYPTLRPMWQTVPCNERKNATYTPCAYDRFSKIG